VRAFGLVTVLLGLAALLGTFSTEPGSWAAARAERADLRIAVWPQGKQRAMRPYRWTLRCGPVAGTLPGRKLACRRLLALSRPFRGVPKGIACTEIYGGPEVAEVRGSLRGRPVTARFTRTDGCQIERWNRVRFLFPAA
jgi:Subtilisin inhibitor-like